MPVPHAGRRQSGVRLTAVEVGSRTPPKEPALLRRLALEVLVGALPMRKFATVRSAFF
jgi:hypothetical protein